MMNLVLDAIAGAIVIWLLKFAAGFVYGLYVCVHEHTGHVDPPNWLYKL